MRGVRSDSNTGQRDTTHAAGRLAAVAGVTNAEINETEYEFQLCNIHRHVCSPVCLLALAQRLTADDDVIEPLSMVSKMSDEIERPAQPGRTHAELRTSATKWVEFAQAVAVVWCVLGLIGAVGVGIIEEDGDELFGRSSYPYVIPAIGIGVAVLFVATVVYALLAVARWRLATADLGLTRTTTGVSTPPRPPVLDSHRLAGGRCPFRVSHRRRLAVRLAACRLPVRRSVRQARSA